MPSVAQCVAVASCLVPFRAIKVEVQRKSITISEANQPEPFHHQCAIPVIKQVADINCACRGCGMCERVCPNNAIRAVRNIDNRRNLFSNRPIKRGGRTNLNAQRTLDKIIVGRISQMTDPSLDSIRHTFDIRSPLGRVLSAKELPVQMDDGKLVMTKKTPPVRWIYSLIFSDMSIGALSTRAWEATQRIVDYVIAFDAELRKLMAPIGNSSLPVGRSDALVSTEKAIADKLGIQYVC